MVYRLKIEQEFILKNIEAFVISFEKSSNKRNLKVMKDFLERKRNVSQIFLDDKIRNKLKQTKDLYYRTKEEVVNEVTQLSIIALKKIENGDLSKALELFEKIVQKLDFDNID